MAPLSIKWWGAAYHHVTFVALRLIAVPKFPTRGPCGQRPPELQPLGFSAALVPQFHPLQIVNAPHATRAMAQTACATSQGSEPSGSGYILFYEYQCIRDIIDQHMVVTTQALRPTTRPFPECPVFVTVGCHRCRRSTEGGVWMRYEAGGGI